MRRFVYVLTVLSASLLVCCQIDDEMYSQYDVYYKRSFTTDSTNAILGSAALKDSIDQKSDVWLTVKGGFEYVADNIARYGHCWATGEQLPVINPNESNCKYIDGKPNAKEPFYTTFTDLECETKYSIRSFIVTKDGHIGYNPEVLVVTTDTPHNKWFESDGFLSNKILAGRTDALCVTSVITQNGIRDTLTFFGMGRVGETCKNDLWCYSSHKKTYEQIPSIIDHGREQVALWGAAGFCISFEDENKKRYNLLYVGCGCAKASNYALSDYNDELYVYDIDQKIWAKVGIYDGDTPLPGKPFIGSPRTGAVGFSIREWGFIGLGEFENHEGEGEPFYQSDFYLFIMDRDNMTGTYMPERGIFKMMTQDFEYGARSGASAVVIDDYAYIIGGKGPKNRYYDEVLPVHFILPVDSRPDAFTFSWPKADLAYHIKDSKATDYAGNSISAGYAFKPRAYAAAFAIGDKIFYGMGEGLDDDGNTEFYYDMVRFDLATMRQSIYSLCAPYKNERSSGSCVSRSMVIHGGDRATVVGGMMQGSGNYTSQSNSEWVYRP